jgi:hypothetical protein
MTIGPSFGDAIGVMTDFDTHTGAITSYRTVMAFKYTPMRVDSILNRIAWAKVPDVVVKGSVLDDRALASMWGLSAIEARRERAEVKKP